MNHKRNVVLAVLCGLLLAFPAQAVTFDDIQFWVGQGSHSAALVIDWNDGKGNESLIWGYRWDGEATGADMLLAVITADTRLYVDGTGWDTGMGYALFGLGYNVTGGDFIVTKGGSTLPFVDRIHNSSYYGQSDGWVAADSLNHWEGGWYTGYWSYWVGGTGTTPAWDYSGDGMSTRILTDGAWDGWCFADFSGYGSGGVPSEPIAAVPVPEPASIVLLLAGVSLLTKRRHRVA